MSRLNFSPVDINSLFIALSLIFQHKKAIKRYKLITFAPNLEFVDNYTFH